MMSAGEIFHFAKWNVKCYARTLCCKILSAVLFSPLAARVSCCLLSGRKKSQSGGKSKLTRAIQREFQWQEMYPRAALHPHRGLDRQFLCVLLSPLLYCWIAFQPHQISRSTSKNSKDTMYLQIIIAAKYQPHH